MRDRKGFTLIELLAVVVILGLVILVAVPFFTGSMKVFRDDFYKNLEGNIEASGKEFFSDNRIYLPHRLLEASIVDVNTLLEDKYMKSFKDYNGNKCENENSYVIAIKMGRDKYEYHSCVKCLDDDYDNSQNNPYCSEAWKDGFTQLTFTEAPTIRIYKGTERNKLKELIKVYPTISRCSKLDVACNNPIMSISAEEEEGVEPIYPKNIDVVNPNKVGEYEVEYQYENHLETIKGKVIVYENVIPNAIIKTGDGFYFEKTNNYVRGTVNTAPVQETTEYDPDDTDDWAQQYLTITFKYTFPNNVPATVARWQIFFNNRWEDYCTQVSGTNNQCVKTEAREMNENVKFRFVDSNGHVSTESRMFNLRIDKTPPTCELAYEEPDGDNDWYVSDINFSFKSKEEPDSSKPFTSARDVNSGELRYGISTGTILSSNKDSDVQNQDTKGITWYGYVEDKANNFTKCSKAVKRDTVDPVCTLKFTGTRDSGKTWFKKGDVTIAFDKHTDATSDVATYGFSTDATGDKSQTRKTSTGSSGLKYTGYIKDKAGHLTSCSSTLYLDADIPTCSTSKSHLNEPDGVTVSFTCDENVGGSTTTCPTQKTKVTKSTDYTVTDAAGNSNTCSVTVSNKQQKQTKDCKQGKTCSDPSFGQHDGDCNHWKDGKCNKWKDGACNKWKNGTCKSWGENCTHYSGIGVTCNGTVKNDSVAGSWHYYDCCVDVCTSYNQVCDGHEQICTGHEQICDGWEQVDNEKEDTKVCGCKEWYDYSAWGDDASCTPNGETEAADHSKTTNCRTVYY